MSEGRRSGRVLASLSAGVVIGLVEVILAVAFATLVFGGYLNQFLPDGIGLYLLGGAITMAVIAWRAGSRGVIGSLQDAAAALLATIAGDVAVKTFANGINKAPGLLITIGPRDAFLIVVAATIIVTVLCGVTFLVLGTFRLGNLIRFVPYPVVGGFLAGTGWLLLKGGVGVAAGIQIGNLANSEHAKAFARTMGQLGHTFLLARWVPALVFGVLILAAVRIVKRPAVIPAALGIGLLLCVIGMLASGSSIQDARHGLWMIGPFESNRLLRPWTYRALTGADWTFVLRQAGNIITAVFVATIACLFNITGLEVMMHSDLDSNGELRDAGVTNLISGPFGATPGYHAVSLTSLARQIGAGGRETGFVAALVPLAAVLFGGNLVQLIPRFLVAGALVFVGLALIVEWLWDVRKNLPWTEYLILLAIFGTIAARDYLTGVEVGLVASVILFATNYGRVELVRQVEFGSTYRSNVDRPTGERQALRAMADRVLILRLNGFVFFGAASGLVERVRRRMEAASLGFLVVDLRRVTGMDSSAVMAFRKVAQLAKANGFEVVFTGAPEAVQAKLRRGRVAPSDGVVRFDPDLDRGLQRVEDRLLAAETLAVSPAGSGDGLAGLPERLQTYFERRTLPEGTVLISQGETLDDLFVLESGRLRVEATTPEGTRMRLSSVASGGVVGEVALYVGGARTADVVAETPAVVLRLTRESLERMEAEEPELAAALHRRLARTLAERASDELRAFDALLE